MDAKFSKERYDSWNPKTSALRLQAPLDDRLREQLQLHGGFAHLPPYKFSILLIIRAQLMMS